MSDDVVVQQVAERAFEHLRRWLRVAYQSDLSDHHANALRIMLDTFARLTLDPAARGRIAIPLPAGAGKSFGIVAFITALNELDPQHPEGGPYSVTVAAQHVENLAALIRDLKEYGNVPDDRIGLQHEKLYSVEKIKAAMPAMLSPTPRCPARKATTLARTCSPPTLAWNLATTGSRSGRGSSPHTSPTE